MDEITVINRDWDISKLIKVQSLLDQEYLYNAGTTRGETFKKRKLAIWVELGELVNEWKNLFKYWSNKTIDREKALVEYVDGIHFILSLGTDLSVSTTHSVIKMYPDPIDHIFELASKIAEINGIKSYSEAFALFRGLGEHMGFNEEEVEAAYHKKNLINKERADHVFFSGEIGII